MNKKLFFPLTPTLRSLALVLSSRLSDGRSLSSIRQVASKTVRQRELRWMREISRIGKGWRK